MVVREHESHTTITHTFLLRIKIPFFFCASTTRISAHSHNTTSISGVSGTTTNEFVTRVATHNARCFRTESYVHTTAAAWRREWPYRWQILNNNTDRIRRRVYWILLLIVLLFPYYINGGNYSLVFILVIIILVLLVTLLPFRYKPAKHRRRRQNTTTMMW